MTQSDATADRILDYYRTAAHSGTRSSHETTDPLLSYDHADIVAVPETATDMSMGCGNPTAVAELRPGETVLDLGSGGGLDVIVSARRVGPTGHVWGLDPLAEMNTLAASHAADAGVDNVDFLAGSADDIPLDAESVDVVISNCVVCLTSDPAAVYAELWRVLRPGGRLAIVDVIADDDYERPDELDLATCGATAAHHSAVLDALRAAGFEQSSIDYTHSTAPGLQSGIVRARKPARATPGEPA